MLPLRLRKTENGNQLLIERILHAKRYSLVVDKSLCVGCEICKTVCPREAIKVTKVDKKLEEKTQKSKIDIDLEKCHYCGICNSMCPFGAIKVYVDDKNVLSVVEKKSFPELIRQIKVNSSKCDSVCSEYEKLCPLNLIKVTFHTPNGEAIKNVSATEKENEKSEAEINIKQESCPCCRLCDLKGPSDAILVQPIFYGALKINEDKCPEGCHDCLDVCPITGTLYLSEDAKKVKVNELFCVYCGACRNVCPVEGALDLQRVSIRHTSIKSGAWNKALEKLASTEGIAKELRAKSAVRAKDAVVRRFEGRKSE